MIGAEVLVQCRDYFWTPSGRRAIALVVVFLISALAVIYASHATRARYASLQTEQHASDTLDSEYEKLLLEQSVWAGYNRVDQLARETLQMRSPDQTNLLVVRPAAEPLSRDEAY